MLPAYTAHNVSSQKRSERYTDYRDDETRSGKTLSQECRADIEFGVERS